MFKTRTETTSLIISCLNPDFLNSRFIFSDWHWTEMITGPPRLMAWTALTESTDWTVWTGRWSPLPPTCTDRPTASLKHRRPDTNTQVRNIRFIHTGTKANMKANFFFDLCCCSMWTLHWILYELILKRCLFQFRFRININESFPLPVPSTSPLFVSFKNRLNTVYVAFYA